MPGAPYTGYVTLGFLATVIVLMALDYPIGTSTVSSLVLIVPALIGGWFLLRDRIRRLAAERTGTLAAVRLQEQTGAAQQPIADAGGAQDGER
jgi:L-asparagine permease